jgi:hypothetical protein
MKVDIHIYMNQDIIFQLIKLVCIPVLNICGEVIGNPAIPLIAAASGAPACFTSDIRDLTCIDSAKREASRRFFESFPLLNYFAFHAGIAQLVEHQIRNLGVAGSNPALGST